MPPTPVDYDPRAIAEARTAWLWYARRSPSAAARFQAELDRAAAEIAADPGRWPRYLLGTRCFRLRRFRYVVVYAQLPASVKVISVAHTSRRPGYWRRRLPP
jgi:plasmid stabilization system protein ParE